MSDKIDRSGWQVGGTTYDLLRERDELRARLAESEAENDQWQKKVADLWRVENERLRATVLDRLDRLEDIAVLLADNASRGQGSMGKPFWEFVDAIRAERLARHKESD